MFFSFVKPFLHLTAFFFVIFFTVPGGVGVTFPAPLNVPLGGVPKISGCGDGAGLHESPDVHGGGDTGAVTHGTAF